MDKLPIADSLAASQHKQEKEAADKANANAALRRQELEAIKKQIAASKLARHGTASVRRPQVDEPRGADGLLDTEGSSSMGGCLAHRGLARPTKMARMAAVALCVKCGQSLGRDQPKQQKTVHCPEIIYLYVYI